MKNSITQITEDFIKKIGEIFKESEKLYETEEAYCFLTVRLNLREPSYKKASGGYEYLADTAVGINERDRISEICYTALLQA